MGGCARRACGWGRVRGEGCAGGGRRARRAQVRVYEQKVKHLEYEHRTAMRRVGENSGSAAATDVSEHESAEEGLRGRLAELRARMDEMEAAHAAEVRSRVTKHDRTLALTRERFRSLTDESRQRHSERLARLEEEMELRRRVELHEAEERKNQHLADMVRNHKRDFAKVKEFFNGITRKNVATIRDLRAQVQQLREKQAASQALMIDISEENRRLAEPLALATEEVLALRADLRDAPKDRLALGNVTSRLREVSHALTRARREHRTLERRFGEAESERDGLYESFEDAVRAVQRRAELRNQALERRLEELSLAFDARAAELDEAVSAARLDPAAVREVVVRVDAAIDAREARLRELHYAVARVAKAHNDALRVFAAKLQRVGADPSELDADEIPTATTTAPAGLVARPNVK